MDHSTLEYGARLKGLAGRYLLQGATIANGLSELQRQLGVAQMLAPANLLAAEHRAQTRLRLAQLTEAFEEYKKFYSAFVLNLSRDVLACTSDLPEDRRNAVIQPLLAQVQSHVNEQASFYESRKTWVDSVNEMLDLFESLPYAVQIKDGSFEFRRAEDLARFSSIASKIDDVAAKERELMQLRAARIQARLPTLGVKVGG